MKTWHRTVNRIRIALYLLTGGLSGAVAPLPLALAGDSAGRDVDLQALYAGSSGVHAPLAGLQIAVLEGGRLTYSAALGFGRRTADGETTALTPAHKMRVASISKLIMTIGLMQLVEAGSVDLDADISRYLSFPLRNPNYPDTPILVRHLLAHTSSIRDAEKYWLTYGEDFRQFFTPEGGHFASGPNKAPGQFFEYTNLNFGVVAAIIERASGQRFDRYMRSQIFDPLGLWVGFSPCDITRTAPEALAATFRRNTPDYVWTPEGPWRAQVDGDKVACYVGMDPVDRADTPADDYFPAYALGSNPTLFSPQGGLRASAEDLAVLMQQLLPAPAGGYGPRLLKPETLKAMRAAQWTYDPASENGKTYEDSGSTSAAQGLMAAYGLSVHIVDLKDWGISNEPLLLYGHLGEAYGLLGQFWYDPNTGNGLIALITGTADDPAKSTAGTSPLYRAEEELLRWWGRHFLGL